MLQECVFCSGSIELSLDNSAVFVILYDEQSCVNYSTSPPIATSQSSILRRFGILKTCYLFSFTNPPNTQPFKVFGATHCFVVTASNSPYFVIYFLSNKSHTEIGKHSVSHRQSSIIIMDAPFRDSRPSASHKDGKTPDVIVTQPPPSSIGSVMPPAVTSIYVSGPSKKTIQVTPVPNDAIRQDQNVPSNMREASSSQRRHVKILPLLTNDAPIDSPTSTKSSPVGNVFSASPSESISFSKMLMSDSNSSAKCNPSRPRLGDAVVPPVESECVYNAGLTNSKFFRRFRSLSSSYGSVYNTIPSFTPPAGLLPTNLPDPDKLPKATATPSQQITFSKCLNLRNYNSASGSLSVRKGVSMDYISSKVNETNATLSLTRHGNRFHEFSKSLANEMLLAQLASIPSRDELEDSLKPAFKHGPKQQAIQMGVRRVAESSRFLMLSKSSMRSPEEFLQHGVEKLEEERAYGTYFHHSTCYDIMPFSSKLVVIDSDLPVGKGFRALLTNEIRAAPIWSSRLQRYIGMLTISDFIRIMNIYNHSPQLKLESVESQTVVHWMEAIGGPNKALLYAKPEDSLMCAARILYHHRVRRIPVLDSRSGNLLFVITHKILLKHLWQRHVDLPPDPRLRLSLQTVGLIHSSKRSTRNKTSESAAPTSNEEENTSPDDQRILDKTDLYCVYPTTAIVKAMRLFVDHDISVLPVIEPESGRLLHMLRTYDCIHLVGDDFRRYLDMTVQHVLQKCPHTHGHLPTCLASDTLQSSIEKFFLNNVQHLVVVDDEVTLIPKAILSLAQVLALLIFDNGSVDKASSSEATATLASSLRETSGSVANTTLLLRSHLRHQRQRHLSYPNESFPEEDDNTESSEHVTVVTTRDNQLSTTDEDVFQKTTT